MRGRTAGLAAASIAVVLGLVVAYRSIGSRQLEAPDPVAEDAQAPAADRTPAALESASAPGSRSEAASETAVAARAEEPKQVPASGTATLQVRVFEAKTRAPLKGIGVFGSKEKHHVGGWSMTEETRFEGDLDHPPVTDEDGEATLSVPAGVDLNVWVHDRRGKSESKHVDVPALRAGEERELRVDLLLGNDLVFCGRVVDRSAGAPIAGAAVRVCVASGAIEPGQSFRDRASETLSSVTADADGLFEIRLPSWRRPFVRVQAPGFAFTVVRRWEGHDSPDRALVVPLSSAASLKARVVDAGGSPIRDVGITLRAQGYLLPLVETGLAGAYVDVPDERWVGTTADDGRAAIDGISPDLPLEVEFRKGNELLRREADPLLFQPGKELEREWVLGGGCRLSGLVLDQDEKPVRSLELWLAKVGMGPSKYFQPYVKDRVTAKATTDADGRFVLPDVAPGTWLLGPAAIERGWTVDASGASRRKGPPDDAIASLGEAIEVPATASREITLHVFRGLFIRGKVLDPEGQGAEASVIAMPSKTEWGPQIQSDPDGTFAVGPLAAGRYELEADALDRFADADPVEAEAGDSDVVLRLKAGGGLKGRLVDARTGKACEAEVLLMPHVEGSGFFGRGVGFGVREDGVLERNGLAPGNYDLAARTEDGCFGILSGIGVVVGETGKEFVLPLSPGGTLNLRYEGSHPVVHVDLRLQGVRTDWGKSVPKGKTVERRAPAGTFTLEVRFDWEGSPRTRTVHLDPGETKEIQIKDDD